MGFFTGAYLKIMTGKMKRQLQFRMTQVTMQMNRVTKQIGDMEKQLQNAENSQRNAIKSDSIFKLQASTSGLFGNEANYGADQKKYQQAQALSQQYAAFAEQNLTNNMEMYRQLQLEPLKNMEDSLATEKATLETRIATLTDQEKAAQEMEKAGAKDMAPNYTGQA